MTNRQPKILFFVPYGSWKVHNQVDAILASALKLRGCEVSILTCDGLYKNCYAIYGAENYEADCRYCAQTAKDFFGIFHLQPLQIRNYLKDGAIAEAEDKFSNYTTDQLINYQHQGVDIGIKVAASVCSYTRLPRESLDQPHATQLLKRYLAYNLATWGALERVYDEFNPTHVCMFNGHGFIHSAALELAKLKNIKIVTHERGVYDGSFIFVSDDYAASLSALTEIARKWEDTPLNLQELERLREFFYNREHGKDVNYYAFNSDQSSHLKTKAELGLPENARILSVFSSSEHELTYYGDELKAVERQFQMMHDLIEIFKERQKTFPNDYLVIRHHPNMGANGTTGLHVQYSMLQRVFKQAQTAGVNVRIIMPDENISSYALLWNSSAAISFFSTIRLEAMARAVPLATINHPQVRCGASHVIEDESKLSLTNLVDDLFKSNENFEVAQITKAYRAANAIFFKHSTSLKSLSIKNGHEFDVRISNTSELLPDIDPVLDRICNYFINDSSIYDLPKPYDPSRDPKLEFDFLKTEIETIKNYKKSLKIRADSNFKNVTKKLCVLKLDSASQNLKQGSTLKLSLEKQRATQISCFEMPTLNDFKLSLTFIHDQINSNLSEDYIAISSDAFYYEQAWSASLISKLELQTNFAACFSPAWVAPQNTTQINSILFGKFAPLKNLASCPQSIIDNPLDLLGFGFFRRESILNLINQLLKVGTSNDFLKILIEFYNSEKVIQTNSPTLVYFSQK